MGRTYTRHVLLCARVQNFTTIGSHLFLHPHPRNCPVTGLGCGLCLHHHQLKLGNTKTPGQHPETGSGHLSLQIMVEVEMSASLTLCRGGVV